TGARYPVAEVVLDYLFSAAFLGVAMVLFRRFRHQWAHRLLGFGLIGAAGAYNLQARVANHQHEGWGVVLSHRVGGAARVAGVSVLGGGWRPKALGLVAGRAVVAGLAGAILAGYAPPLGFLVTFCLLIPLAVLIPLPGRSAALVSVQANRTAWLARSVSAA